MKTFMLITILAALPFTSFAQTSSSPSSMTITGSKIAPPNQVYKMKVGEFDDVKGQYDLENGKTLTMSNTGKTMYADIDGVAKVELVAAAPNIFVAKNRQMKMVFDQEANGIVDRVTVMYVVPRAAGENSRVR